MLSTNKHNMFRDFGLNYIFEKCISDKCSVSISLLFVQVIAYIKDSIAPCSY